MSGCATKPPTQKENICEIFYEKRDWFDAAADMREKMGVYLFMYLWR